MSKKTKLTAVLLTAAFLSPTAFAGGDGRPCFWKEGGYEKSRTVAESPVPEAEGGEAAPEFIEPIEPDENFVVRLDENGDPILPEAAELAE